MGRSDGRRIRNLDPEYILVPHLMKERTGSLLYYQMEVPEEPFNEYIKINHENGRELSLQTLLIAGLVRTIALRPGLNRFIMAGKIYARNLIQVSMQVKRTLDENSQDGTAKFTFTGKENVFEVNKKINDQIRSLKNGVENKTDSLIALLFRIPSFVLRIIVNTLWFMDRRGILPKSIIEASPFHTSIYFSNLRSIRVGSLYHHLYDFGNAGIFVSLCRSTKKLVLDKDGSLVEKRFLDLRLCIDERICDGFYWSTALRQMEKIIMNFSALEENLEETVRDID